MTDSERQTIERLKEGHEKDWASLFDTLAPPLLDTIKRIVGDQEQAEDLMNTIMLLLVNKIRSVSTAPADPQ